MKLISYATLAGALLVACSFDEPLDAKDIDRSIEEPAWLPLKADQSYGGKSLADWLVEWKRWTFSHTTCDTPVFDRDGSLCGMNQDPGSPVFFLEQSAEDLTWTECRIPSGKALAVPVAVVSEDDVGDKPHLTEEEVEQIVTNSFGSMRDMVVEADGVSFDDSIDGYAVEPMRFTFDLPAGDNWFNCNGLGDVGSLDDEPSWLAGYMMLFPPPEQGEHELRFGGVQTYLENEYYLGVSTKFVVE